MQNFMRELGWDLPAPSLDLPFADAARLPALILAVTGAESPLRRFEAVVELYIAVESIFSTIDGLEQDVTDAFAGSQAFLDASGIADDYELPRRLTDYLVATYLRSRHPQAHSILVLLGLVEYVDRPADAAAFQSAFILKRLRWERLSTLLTDPGVVISEVYQWGQPGFDAATFLDRFALLLRAFHVPGGLYARDPDFTAALDPGASDEEKELRIPVYAGGSFPETYVQLGLALARAAAANPGLALLPYVIGTAAKEFPLTEKWKLTLTGGTSLEGGLALVLLPGAGLTARANLLPNGGAAAAELGDAEIGLTLTQTTAEEMVLFGQAGHSRFAVDRVEVRGAGRIVDGDGELVAQLQLTGAKIVLSGGDFDGFIAKVLPKQEFRINFDLGVIWSSKRGFHIDGGAGLEKTFAVHLSLFDVIQINSVGVAVYADAGGAIEGMASTNVDVRIGPVIATIQEIGIETALEMTPEGGGNLGVMNVRFGFKPPTGAGLAIESGPVSGGGFLQFDRANAQYSGILSLAFQDLDLTAIALLTTRMPDGSRGFSLVALIAVDFNPPFALGYGFFLHGVGGLIGVNRTMNLDAIQAGIRTGAIDSILFPEDPIANAPRIISDLRSIFPPQEGRFVFGPMVNITWGVPTLIEGQIAILIELPPPIRLAILGQLQAILPDSEESVVQLRVDVAGLVDFAKATLSIDATLFDSHIVIYPLTGDMAVRSSWGHDSYFALAVGGGHPAYKFPPRFPKLRRLTVSIGKNDNPRLRMETYFALTENTVQFGARAEIEASMSKFKVRGDLAFDTLMQFSPFAFEADVRARIAVRLGGHSVCSATLAFQLEGPTPWRARGKAKFKVCCVSYSVGFDKTFGRSSEKKLPRLDPWPPFRAAIGEPANWVPLLPREKGAPVIIRDVAPPADGPSVLIVDPVGELVIRQKVVPLGVQITRFGKGRPPSSVTFDLSGSAEGLFMVHEPGEFAPGDFWDRSKSDLLSSRYESHKSGVRVAGSAIDYVSPIGMDVVYEEDYEPAVPNSPPAEVNVSRDIGLAGARLAAARFARQFAGVDTAAPEKRITVQQRTYVIANTSDLTPTSAPMPEGAAWALLADLVTRHPANRSTLQILEVEKKAVA